MALSLSFPQLIKLSALRRSVPPVTAQFLATSSTSQPFEHLIRTYRPVFYDLQACDLQTCVSFFPQPALKSTLWYQKGEFRYVWKIVRCIDAPLFAVMPRIGTRHIALGLASLEKLLISLLHDDYLPPEVLLSVYTACTKPAIASGVDPALSMSVEVDLA